MIQTGDCIADGLDDAIIGVATMIDGTRKVIYSCDKCIDIFMKDGMTDEEATEYFEYNTLGAYVGKQTPIFLWESDYATI
jgi:hypothetical protein